MHHDLRFAAALVAVSWVLGACDGAGPGPIEPDPVASISIAPHDPTLDFGQVLELHAVPRDAAGRPLSRPVTWTSGNPDIAAVDGIGRVRPVRAGEVAIQAHSEGRSTAVVLRVLVPAELIGGYSLQGATGRVLPALVHTEPTEEGVIEVLAEHGTLSVDEAGRYTQQVRHTSWLDGIQIGYLSITDHGVCEITATQMRCGSEHIQGVSFTAGWTAGELHVHQDIIRQTPAPRPVLYFFGKVIATAGTPARLP